MSYHVIDGEEMALVTIQDLPCVRRSEKRAIREWFAGWSIVFELEEEHPTFVLVSAEMRDGDGYLIESWKETWDTCCCCDS